MQINVDGDMVDASILLKLLEKIINQISNKIENLKATGTDTSNIEQALKNAYKMQATINDEVKRVAEVNRPTLTRKF